jgi:hypothetical protein
VSSASPDSLVKCSLQVFELSDGQYPNYSTLSYTWGQQLRTIPILVNNEELMITSALFEAIKHLQEFQRNGTVSSAYWWIDMICINQEDLLERGHQVIRMKDIFQRSEVTLAWLGPAADDSDRAMEALRHKSTDDDSIKALIPLLARNYWKRVWIIQEICIAPQLLVACGGSTMPWPDNGKLFCSEWIADNQIRGYAHRLDLLRRAVQNSHTIKLTLASLLSRSYLNQSTDSRDGVYGILALINTGACTRILPDYTKSPCAVFCEAFRAMSEDQRNANDRSKRDDEHFESTVGKAKLSRHNPFDENDVIRISCNGLDPCDSFSLFLAMGTR